MQKLHDAETNIKHETGRKSAGIDVNSFEAVVAILCILAGYGFLSEGRLPPSLRDAELVRVLYQIVSGGYMLSGAGIVVGLGFRRVFIERAALLLLATTLACDAALELSLPALGVDVLQVALTFAVFLACLGRLRVLRLIR